MSDERQTQAHPLPVACIPDGDEPADELRAELRMADEVLAVCESREHQSQPPAPPATMTTRRRLNSLSPEQLRRHITRLERDCADAERGFTSEQHCQLNGQLDYDEDGER